MENQNNNLTISSADVNSNFISFFLANNIEIPLIQRDYVQGSNYQHEKRDAFIDSLYLALTDESNTCELDFIYGTYDHGSFIPLDGQQRLTTLYLLHWFLMNKCRIDNPVEYSNIVQDINFDQHIFSYKTRRSSTAFCQKLMSFCPQTLSGKISHDIVEQTWFSEDWLQDPTVQSMLEMLDALNAKFSQLSSPNTMEMLKRLLYTKAINFDKLDMQSYRLTDSLYVKMNARGKQLTEFENWKAKFIQYLEENYDNQKYNYAEENRKDDYGKIKDYFTHSIEHEWTDLFWTYAVKDYKVRKSDYDKLSDSDKMLKAEPAGPLVDSFFLNFYFYVYRILSFLMGKEKENENDNNSIHGTETSRQSLFKEITNIEFFFRSLDLFVQIEKNNENKIQGFFDELFYLEGQKTDGSIRLFSSFNTNLFESCIINKASVDEQILLFCIIYYCLEQKCYSITDELKKYVRVCRNLLESINQRLKKDMKIHSNVRFSNLPSYVVTIRNLCSVKDLNELESFKNGMGDAESVESAYNWMKYYPNEDIYYLEDSGYTHGSLYAFDLSSNISDIREAFEIFKKASDLERVRLLVACGYKGMNYGGCAHGIRRFWGYRDRWDVLFRYKTDSSDFKAAFKLYVEEYKKKQNIATIIADKQAEQIGKDSFIYYFLKYDAFANSSLWWVMDDVDDLSEVDGHHFFAVASEHNIITLPRFSSNPLLGYHTDPYACAVAQYFAKNYTDIIYSHIEYTGKDKYKARLTFDDKNVELLCEERGWLVIFKEKENGQQSQHLSFTLLRKLCRLCYHIGKRQNYVKLENQDRIISAIMFIKALYGQ